MTYAQADIALQPREELSARHPRVMPCRVVCVVLNDVKRDARVLKQAKSLQAAGYEVEVFGIRHGAETVELQHEGLVLTLVGYVGPGRAAILTRLVSLMTRGLFLAFAFAVSVLIFSMIVRAVGAFEYATALAIVLTVAATALIYRRRRSLTAAARSLVRAFRILRKSGRRRRHGRPGSTPATTTATPSRLVGTVLALLDSPSCTWIAQLIDMQSALCNALSGKKIDILHCHDFTTLRTGVALKQQRPSLKLVYDSHELFSAVHGQIAVRHNWIKLEEARASRSIDACLTVNDSIAKELKSYYPKLPDPVVVCNATPLRKGPFSETGVADACAPIDDGRLRKAAGLTADRKILLFQGGIARHRGLPALTMAATFLPEEWCLVYMGWGNYEKDVKLIAELVDTPGERIRFVPPVPQCELAEWTAGATIGVIPYEPVSLNHIYCSPNKLWEYPRSGVPVLCSDAPEMRRRVERYGFGWIIPRDRLTPRGIAGIVASLSDAEIARAKRACRDFILADNWCVYEKRLLDVYGHLSAAAEIRLAHEAGKAPVLDLDAAGGGGPG
jgi:glycosyltransferase involved in cell wall biosynthesis